MILTDEPTTSDDRPRGRALMQLLGTYAHTTWAAVLVATHDERALDLADGVIAIEDGLDLPALVVEAPQRGVVR